MIPSTGGNLHTRRARGAPQVPHWRCLPSCSGRRVRRGSPGPVRGAPDSCLKSGPIERGAQWGKGDPPIGISFSTAPRGDGETRFSRKAPPAGSWYWQKAQGPGHYGRQVQHGLTAARRRTERKCGAPEGASPCHGLPGDRRCQPQASLPEGERAGVWTWSEWGSPRGNPLERNPQDSPAQTPFPLPTEFAGKQTGLALRVREPDQGMAGPDDPFGGWKSAHPPGAWGSPSAPLAVSPFL
ncbi:hypothetical protein ACOMHN_021981 [Nucella lapillus]